MKLPALHLEAEMAALGSALIERWAALKVVQLLRVSDFYDERHRLVYEAIERITEQGATFAVDSVLVAEELRRAGELEKVGGGSYLAQLTDKVATAGHVEHYVRYVKEASLERQIAHQIEIVQADSTPSQVKDLGDLILSLQGNRGVGIFDMRHDLGPMLEEILERPEPGILCGIGVIDELVTGNFHKGELWTIGARPGGGKTALMLRLAAVMATRLEPAPEVLYITSEMRTKEMVSRLLPMATGIPHSKFRTGRLSPGEITDVLDAGSEMSLMPLKIAHRSRPSMDDIRGIIFQAKPQVVFIDYLQRCRLGRADNLPHAISEFYADLKSFALDTGCIIFIGCQTDRESDKFPNIPPTMSHLKGSGGIESESDGVMMLWQPPMEVILKRADWVPPSPGMDPIEVIFRKNRNGPRDVKADMELDGQLIKMCERLGPDRQQEVFS